MHCPRCHINTDDEFRFCTNCGYDFLRLESQADSARSRHDSAREELTVVRPIQNKRFAFLLIGGLGLLMGVFLALAMFGSRKAPMTNTAARHYNPSNGSGGATPTQTPVPEQARRPTPEFETTPSSPLTSEPEEAPENGYQIQIPANSFSNLQMASNQYAGNSNIAFNAQPRYSNSTANSQPNSEQISGIRIFYETVKVNSLYWKPFLVGPGGGTVLGRLEGTGGIKGEFECFIMDDDGLVNLRNGQNSWTFYNSGRVVVAKINVTLTPGFYYLVIRNLSPWTTRSVTGSVIVTNR